VRFEVAQELDHRRITCFAESTFQDGVLRLGEERTGCLRVVLHGHAAEDLENGADEHVDVAVLAAIVLGDGLAEPSVVFAVRSLPRLPIAQRHIALGHLNKTHQDEPQLHWHRFLAPQRAVVVEYSDAFGGRNVPRSIFVGHVVDELHNGPLCCGVVPRWK
jgi:hypothetical protein